MSATYLLILLCVLLTCGCKKQQQQQNVFPPEALHTVFDEVLAKPEYSNAIVQAERDLPTDKWEQKPFTYNASRGQREGAVADQMLQEVTPQLKLMNITNLVGSLKLISHPLGALTNNFRGVAEILYIRGNGSIINEIKSRSTKELQALRSLGNDTSEIYEGPQGYPLPLRAQLEGILQDIREGITNKPTQ